MRDAFLDKTTTLVAMAGIASPAWIPPLKDLSEIAGQLMPIFGVAWLLVQIVTKLRGK